MVRKWISAFVVCAVAAVMLVVIFSDEPKLPVGSANGVFANDCCGTIVLNNGTLSVGGKQTVRYAVEEDKQGPYVIPAAFIGVFDRHRVQVDGSMTPLKLRLDSSSTPDEIELTDLRSSYVFSRQAPKVR